jgi:hypothetical protein
MTFCLFVLITSAMKPNTLSVQSLSYLRNKLSRESITQCKGILATRPTNSG